MEYQKEEDINLVITMIDLHFGGISNLILQSSPALSKKMNLKVVYFGSNEDMLPRFKKANIDTVRIPYTGGKGIIKTARKLSDFIKENRINVVSTNFLPDKTIVSLARLFTRFKIIGTIHNSFNPEITPLKRKSLRFRFEEFFHNHIADKIIAVSNSAKENAFKYRNLKNKNVSVVYSGIIPLADSKRHDPRITEEKIHFITTCRLVPIKGLRRLIDCFNHESIKNLKWKLKIVGDGELKNELMKKVSSLGLESKITFLGYQDDVQTLLKDSHFYINSSYNEALGISLIEAMSMGLPLIGPNVGGIPEVIEENTNGFLVNFNEPDKTSKVLSYAINIKKEAYNQLSENSYKIFHEKFSIEKYVLTLNKEIQQLIISK